MASELSFWSVGEEVSVREAFGRVLVHQAQARTDWMLLDADVAGGTGAKPLVQNYPDRVVQFGIAEQNMMAAAGGMADVGLIPVVSTFAAFGCMRAHEQFRTAIAYPYRNVKLCCSHVGMDVGPDGATAQMLEDLAIMRAIPGVTVVSPADANEFMNAFIAILDRKGPVYMRIGRSPTRVVTDGSKLFEIGKSTCLKEGSDVAVVATGVMTPRALDAAKRLAEDGVSVRVINMSSIKPLDQEALLEAASQTTGVVTAEDHSVVGGLGGAVAEFLSQHYPTKIKCVGVHDRFGKSGEHTDLPAAFGIDAPAIVKACREIISG